MPTYQYACPDCGTDFERVQKFADDPIKKCPKCGKRHVYRVVSKVAVSFKGSGWYITDSKSNSTNGAAKKGDEKDKAEEKTESKSETETKTETETTKETSAEAKTETKTESKSENKAEAKSDKKPGKKKAE